MRLLAPNRRRYLAVLLLTWIGAPTLHAEAPAKLTGTLTEKDGVKVLRLAGDAGERGYTYGYLLGPEIRGLFENIILSPAFWGDIQKYEQGMRPQLAPLFSYTSEERAELEGMLAGMRDRIGADAMQVASVGRAIDLVDLIAANAYADVQNGACTSFAAWGPATRDGGTIVGRNLDFPRLPGLAESQLIVVYQDVSGDGKRWATVSFPGMIGAYTAMNEDGVFVSMHDVRAPVDWATAPFVPRSLAIRHIMEHVGAENTAQAAVDLLRKTHAYCGNNFLVAAPFTGQENPVVVLEYDGVTADNDGVTMRTTAWKDHRLPENTIACTNHYRERGESIQCDRYFKVRRVLRSHPTGEIDADLARAVQQSAAMQNTLHTVVAQPNRREFNISFCTAEKDATTMPTVSFTLDELFEKTVAAAE